MRKYDIVIIGGGASGIMSAINANVNKSIAIIDKADKLGKKILATGNGRCNITNNNISWVNYNTPNVEKYFAKYGVDETLKDFKEMGLITYSDNEGRRYPMSNSANSVLDILIARLKQCKNVDVFTNKEILKIEEVEKGFNVITKQENFVCKKLVISAGSWNVDAILHNLNVKYSAFTPSLVSLRTDRNKGLAGVRVSNVEVSYHKFRERGEILFKEDGISGIVIFNLSAIFARNNIRSGKFSIDLLPDMSNTKIIEHIKLSCRNNDQYNISLILEGLLHKALAKNIVDKIFTKDIFASELKMTDIDKIAQLIKNYQINFNGVSDNNQTNCGGVSLNDLTEDLEYKHTKGLYFAGEIVDVDGVCGGYNLQWAWTSGKIVGDAL